MLRGMEIRVYGTGRENSRLHKTPECTALLHGAAHPIRELSVWDLRKPEFCRRCFTEVPQVKVWHARCRECYATVRPCKHNGGVLVYDSRDTRRRFRYAWPEDVHRYTLANPVLLD